MKAPHFRLAGKNGWIERENVAILYKDMVGYH